MNPLHGAAGKGSVELVRMLLEHGAEVNAWTKARSILLLMAAESGIVEVVQVLIKQGANVDVEDEEEETLLHRAARTGSVELVRMLLEHGADVHARTTGSWCWTPLLMAVGYGDVNIVEVAQMLLEYGSDLNARTKDGSNRLLMAVEFQNVGIVRMLIKRNRK